MGQETNRVTVRGTVRIALVLAGCLLFVAASSSRPLPILFSPPPNYRVLRKLGQRGELGYTESMNGFVGYRHGIHPNGLGWNGSILAHWLRVAQGLGANALLLRPYGNAAVKRYAADAIRVRGSPCTLPFQCWSPGQIVVGRHRNRAVERAIRFFRLSQAFALSIAVKGFWRTTYPGTLIGHLTSADIRRSCPNRPWRGEQWLLAVARPAVATVDTGGRVVMDHLIIPPIWGDNRLIVRMLRYWHFRGGPAITRSIHLLMDWHIVPLRKGQPIPRGVVCVYPTYPSSGWRRGKRVRHLRWPVYALREGSRKVLFAANPAPVK